jgi:hypothetical protein
VSKKAIPAPIAQQLVAKGIVPSPLGGDRNGLSSPSGGNLMGLGIVGQTAQTAGAVAVAASAGKQRQSQQPSHRQHGLSHAASSSGFAAPSIGQHQQQHEAMLRVATAAAEMAAAQASSSASPLLQHLAAHSQKPITASPSRNNKSNKPSAASLYQQNLNNTQFSSDAVAVEQPYQQQMRNASTRLPTNDDGEGSYDESDDVVFRGGNQSRHQQLQPQSRPLSSSLQQQQQQQMEASWAQSRARPSSGKPTAVWIKFIYRKSFSLD